MTVEEKERIDNMTQEELCSMWRFASVGEPLFQGDTGDYFSAKLKERGGFTPEISKRNSKRVKCSKIAHSTRY